MDVSRLPHYVKTPGSQTSRVLSYTSPGLAREPKLPRKTRRPKVIVPLVALLAVMALTACDQTIQSARQPDQGQMGSCHALMFSEEFDATSDSRPAVPCTEPHTTETFSTSTVTGALTEGIWATRRPNQQQLNALTDQLCGGDAVRSYLNAGERDAWIGLAVRAYFPTPQAWSEGDRSVRCDLVATRAKGVAAAPQLNHALSGIMATPDAAPFRQCFMAGAQPEQQDTVCSEPHTAISVNAWLSVTTPDPAPELVQEMCEPFALQYANDHNLPLGAVTGLTTGSQETWTLKCAMEDHL
ncbi:hypothetical protein MB46_00680 [Arthrobacter alpinus]|uniref:septum formation family protein n=1 Tax=Arthrobacter alpinus TaxID=656366 RepID=UPI0005C847A8|nr:septum formation family protein [Arthrobacter alpinus]ALV44247.1 hypothetical protein MB46_00680 [Arthrobacter alpinus]